MPQGIQLDGGRELEDLTQARPLWGILLRRVIDAVNRIADNARVSPFGELPSPPPVDSILVKGTITNNVLTAPGELLHFVHTHNVSLNRGVQYVTEIDTSPNFPSPHPIDTGSSRSGFITLPTKDDNAAQVKYYLRVTSQYHGSKPSQITVFGGLQNPTAIIMSGSTNATLLPSQAGGTAKPQQGGQGLGSVRARSAVGGPKRQLTTL